MMTGLARRLAAASKRLGINVPTSDSFNSLLTASSAPAAVPAAKPVRLTLKRAKESAVLQAVGSPPHGGSSPTRPPVAEAGPIDEATILKEMEQIEVRCAPGRFALVVRCCSLSCAAFHV